MPWISVDDAKAHLNKDAAVHVDDTELTAFIPAACAVIEELKGHVDVVGFTESLLTRRIRLPSSWPRPDRNLISLSQGPVLAIDAVQLVAGAASTPVLPASTAEGVDGWLLTDTVLYVPRSGAYTVSYHVGLNPVPGNIRLAALELVAHLWRGSQLNADSGRPAVGGDQMQVVPHIASALPYRIRELLGIYGDVVPDHVVIA